MELYRLSVRFRTKQNRGYRMALNSTKSALFIVTIKRGDQSEPESFYIPAPDDVLAKRRACSIAKIPKGAILSVEAQAEH
jgi:hypothetical protein